MTITHGGRSHGTWFYMGAPRTTEALRQAIQHNQKSLRTLARQHGTNPTTVQKRRKQASVSNAPMGPKALYSTVLIPEEEAMIVAFRHHMLLPLEG
jgi:hypothetical protein